MAIDSWLTHAKHAEIRAIYYKNIHWFCHR
jgi:hypothetical protein